MSAIFEDVKAVLNHCVGQDANWNRIARRHRNPDAEDPDSHLFGWETEEQLLNAKARGYWLINPEFRGTGEGEKTNLVQILTRSDGLFGYPRMPLVGNKIDIDSPECATLIEWINNLPSEERTMKNKNRNHGSPDQIFLDLGAELPPPPILPPGLNFVQIKRHDSILHLSGMGPQWGAGFKQDFIGKIWSDLSIEEGYAAARLTGLNLLHVVRGELGTLDRVKDVLEIYGMVNGAPSFTKSAQVLNGCSDLMVEIFGESGKHVRTAAGGANPFDIAVYIKMAIRFCDESISQDSE